LNGEYGRDYESILVQERDYAIGEDAFERYLQAVGEAVG
jgi:hypothetical protein